MAKVSVIIPTYNRAHLVSRAIKSVLNQNFQDFEIIVVDDGSTDNTEEVIKSFKDKRIRYIWHEINKGGNAARNTGLKNSRGEYIAFLDSDDEWLPEKLERQLEIFEKSQDEKLGFVYCGVIFINKKENKELRFLPKVKGYVYKNMLADNITFGGSDNLIKKEVFNICGFFDECEELKKRGAQEYEMWIRIAQKFNFTFVKEYLVKYYTDPIDKITTIATLQDKARAREYIVNKFIEEYKKIPKILSDKLRRMGTLYCLGGNIKKGRVLFLKSIRYNFFNIVSYFCLLISLFGASFYNEIFSLKIVINIKPFKQKG